MAKSKRFLGLYSNRHTVIIVCLHAGVIFALLPYQIPLGMGYTTTDAYGFDRKG